MEADKKEIDEAGGRTTLAIMLATRPMSHVVVEIRSEDPQQLALFIRATQSSCSPSD